MQVVVLFNPRSGRGKAVGAAHELVRGLTQAGHTVALLETKPASESTEVAQALRDAGGAAAALIVVGGDGTVLSASAFAVESGAPLYHYPMGTENLFGRAFGMTGTIDDVLKALCNHEERLASGQQAPVVDIGVCNGRAFLVMASVGFDANVVHRVARRRGTSISHMSYVPHILRECLAPHSRPVTIRVDGREVVAGRCGMVIVANSKHYAMRSNPARNADMTDGLLDVCFMPTRHPLTAMLWLQRAKWGMHMDSKQAVHVRGECIEVTTTGSALPFQLDGEAPPPLDEAAGHNAPTTPMTLTVRPGALPVLRAPL